MKKIRNISSIVIITVMAAVLFATTIMSVGAVYRFNGANMITDSDYRYYRAWSQDQFPWHNTKPSDAWESDWMNRYGCSTVAMAKMFVEAGVANPRTVNPGTLMTKYGTPSLGIGDIGIYWSNLTSHFGMTCESFQYYPNGSFYNTAMSFFNRTDHNYHLLLKVTLAGGGPHYVQVDRQATIDSGELVFNDSTNTSDGGTRYNTKEDYWKACSLKTLSQMGFTPNFFVVFYHDDTLKLRKVEEINSTTAKLTWYPNGCCQNYIVYRRLKGEKSWTGKRVAVIKHYKGEGVRYYLDKSLKMGKEYEYTVRGTYKVKGKEYSIKYNSKGLSISTHPDPPVLVSAESQDMSSIVIKWKPVSNADGYRVYRKASGEKTFKAIKKNVTKTTYTDKTPKCGVKYYYTVRAYKGDKDFLGSYNKKGLSCTAVPQAPKLEKAESIDFSTIKITWKEVKGADGYYVYRKGDGVNVFGKIGTVNKGTKTEFSDLSPTTGQKYLYTVRAYKTVDKKAVLGKYQSGIAGVAYTNPPMVRGYSSTSSDRITIRWDKVKGASGYIVYRKVQGDKSYKKVCVIEGNGNVSYTDTKLKAGREYLYKIKSYRTVSKKKICGYSSDALTAYTHPAQPVLTSTKSLEYNTIQIKWKSSEGATAYRVFRKINGSKYSILADVKGTSYKDDAAITGVKYNYTVRAYTETKAGRMYSTYKNYIYGTAYPAQPKISSVKNLSYRSIQLKWTKVEGATGYKIFRKKQSAKSFSSAPYGAVGSNATSFTDNAATCGQTYVYRIKAVRVQNKKEYTGAYSAQASGKALTTAPTVKVNRNDYKSLSISWNMITGADGYRVYYKNNSKEKWKVLATFESSTLSSCVHSGLTTGKRYYYTVKAAHKTGKKMVWGNHNATGVSNTPVTASPKLVSASCKAYKTVEVCWKTVAGATGYRIYRKTEGSSKWVAIANLSSKASSYSDKNAACGEKYHYTVRSFRKVGGKTVLGLYNGTGLSAVSIPETPLLTLSSTNYNKIKLTWNYCYGATGYKIYRKAPGGSYSFYMRITSQKTTTATDTVECGVEYSYYVTAYRTVDKVEYGSYDSIAKSCKAVPPTPTLVSVTSNSKGTATLTWKEVSCASGYHIYVKEPHGTYKNIYDATSGSVTSFTNKNLESGKKLTYTVVAYRICPAGYIRSGYNKTGLTVTVK